MPHDASQGLTMRPIARTRVYTSDEGRRMCCLARPVSQSRGQAQPMCCTRQSGTITIQAFASPCCAQHCAPTMPVAIKPSLRQLNAHSDVQSGAWAQDLRLELRSGAPLCALCLGLQAAPAAARCLPATHIIITEQDGLAAHRSQQ